MTAQQILVRSLDWKLVMTKAGAQFSDRTTKALNSLVEYLCTIAEIDAESECQRTEHQAGAPYQQDLQEVSQ